MSAPATRPFRPWSMTARLVGLQVLALALLMGGALVALYTLVGQHLEQDNRELLRNQTIVLSHWLGENPGRIAADSAEGKHRIDLLSNIPEIHVRVRQSDGTELFASVSSRIPPAAAFPGPERGPIDWRSPAGGRFLLDTVRLDPANAAYSPLMCIAYDVSDDDALLYTLRERSIIVFVLALLLCGIAALMIARGVFRPLAQLAAAAARVQASQLSSRVGDAEWPAELGALAREFDAMLARLDESFRRLARFSSDLSHELRTPINNLRGEAEVALSQNRSPEDYRRVLESGLEECARLGRLIDTLLFIAKADNPEHGIRCRELDAAAEGQAVMDFFEAVALERRLTLLVRGTAKVYCDAELLRRAVANLVDNALRHTAPGGHVDLTVREGESGSTEIEVRDNGIGIEPTHATRVFERFYRGERAPGAVSGFGLGLAIVKSIMDLHRGTVELASVPGIGTTITLRFPAAPR
ncbi:MAG TPA: heavy metal sensor histidine kinase [Candidatus Didemnitutus sp.]|nr:heavy metal sensor histidine kinase [Candidatus Didemnitutus sp.]